MAINDSVTGRAIGTDTNVEQIAFGNAYLAAHPITADHRFFTTAELAEIMLGMAQIAGNAIITHVPGWDMVTSAPNAGAGFDRPMPALAQQVTALVGGTFVALWLKTGTSATAWTCIVGAGGAVQLSSATPLSDCPGGHPGNLASGRATAEGHRHPREDPAVEGSSLFPALIPDPYMRYPTAKCVLHVDYDLVSTSWTKITGISTWQRNTPGKIYGIGSGNLPNVELAAFDRFVVWHTGWTADYEPNLYGLYEVLSNDGGHAVVRRATDANTPETFYYGMTVQIAEAEGIAPPAYAGQFFQLIPWEDEIPIELDVTYVDFAFMNPYVPVEGGGEAYRLLTAAQLTTEGASTETLDFEWTMASGDAPGPYGFETLAGVPGVDVIPAGPWAFDHEAVWLEQDPGGETTLKWQVYRLVGTSVTLLFTAQSPPIHNTTPQALSFQYPVPETAFSPSYQLVAIPVLSTTSAVPVTLHLRYNSAARGTRIRTTFQMAGAAPGVTHHPLLTGRGEPNQHPWGAMEPAGTATFPMPALTVAAGGKLTLGAGNIFVVNPAGLDLTQITPPGCPAQTTVPLRLIFTGPTRLQHQVVSDVGFANLYLHRAGSVNNPLAFKYEWAVADFVFVGGNWLLAAYHSTQ